MQNSIYNSLIILFFLFVKINVLGQNVDSLYYYYKTEDYSKAIKQGQLILEELHDSNDANYQGTVLLWIALSYQGNKNYLKAEENFSNSLIAYSKSKNSELEIATIKTFAGLFYIETRDFIKVEPLLNDALKIRKDFFGEFDRSYALSLDNLALYYREIGEYDKAEVFYNQALEISKKLDGDNNNFIARVLNDLSLVYQKKKKSQESKRLTSNIQRYF